MRYVFRGTLLVLALTLGLAHQGPAYAGAINGSVSLDTSGLSGTFELAFIFIDGSGTADANNTVALDNFFFGTGGSAGAVDSLLTTGGGTGTLGTGVTLVDSDFFNILAATFTAGTHLSFGIALTTEVDAGGTPDQFSIALLQANGTQIATTDPSGANALLSINIDSARPAFSVFASDLTPAPIAMLPATVPEPSTVLLLVIGLALVMWSRPKAPARPAADSGIARS
jgi:hypothetical protein